MNASATPLAREAADYYTRLLRPEFGDLETAKAGRALQGRAHLERDDGRGRWRRRPRSVPGDSNTRSRR